MLVFDEIIRAAIGIATADMANLQLPDATSGSLRIVASDGFGQRFLDFFDAVHADQAACGAALRHAERVIVEDVASSPIFADAPVRDVMLEAGALSVQSTPIFGRSGRLIGMLSTHRHAVGRPEQRQLRLLDVLAHHAGRNIERLSDGPRAATRTGSSDDRERSAALVCRSLYIIQCSGTLLHQSDERIGKSRDVIAISKHIVARASPSTFAYGFPRYRR